MARAPTDMFGTAPALRLAGGLLLFALAGCTVQFTPGDAKPALFTPYPSGAASGDRTPDGEGIRSGPGP